MLVPLNSLEGKRRFEESGQTSASGCALQREIVESFRKQRGNTVCGLASLAVVLTARKRSLAKANGKIDTLKETPKVSSLLQDDDSFVDEDDVYSMVIKASSDNNNKDTCDIVSEEKIRESGMTLQQVRKLAEGLPTTERATAFFPSIIPPTGQHQQLLRDLQDVRELLLNVLSKPPSSEGLVLNYHMSTLGQVPFGGHLSPVAAYHSASDSLLVMDVWHTQTEPVWAPLRDVWEAISKIDSESQSPRGLLHLVHDKNGD